MGGRQLMAKVRVAVESGSQDGTDAVHLRRASIAEPDFFCGFGAVQDSGQTHQGSGGAGRTLLRAISDAVTVFAEVRTGQRHVLHGHKGHIVTPIIVTLNVNAHIRISVEEGRPQSGLSCMGGCGAQSAGLSLVPCFGTKRPSFRRLCILGRTGLPRDESIEGKALL